MEIVKIPPMEKEGYDQLIADSYISRIAFTGRKYPYIAPLLYVFDGQFMYFLSTKYESKIHYFRQNPYVTVEQYFRMPPLPKVIYKDYNPSAPW